MPQRTLVLLTKSHEKKTYLTDSVNIVIQLSGLSFLIKNKGLSGNQNIFVRSFLNFR